MVFKSLFALVLLFSLSSFGAITVKSINGVSATGYSSGRYILYGGTAGTAPGSCAATATCNSCTGGGLTACNPKMVQTTTQITIVFSSNSMTGNGILTQSSGSYTQLATAVSSPINADSDHTLKFTWSDVCGQLGSTDCETVTASGSALNSAVVLRIGVDKSGSTDNKLDGTNDDYIDISFQVQSSMADTVSTTTEGSSTTATNGIYGWSVFPGDGKVYLEGPQQNQDELSAWSGFPSSAASIQYKNILVYRIADKNCTTGNALFTNATADYTTLSIASDGALEENRIFDLINDTPYVFKIALEDQAGNIGLFYPTCTTGKHDATPSEVFGLLQSQKNCFIATAAFGSPLNQKIQVLRDFRDKYLIPTTWGKAFVKWYYQNGPKYADWISQHEASKGFVRWVLYPVIGFANLALLIGFEAAVIVTLSILASALVIVDMLLRKKKAI